LRIRTDSKKDIDGAMAHVLNYIFNTEATLSILPRERKQLILTIINTNATRGLIPQYMRLIEKDTLAILCHEIKKYNYYYGHELYEFCK
jgi:hypothetical protein